MPPKASVARDSIQKKEEEAYLTAVVVADHYEARFEPLLKNYGPWCLNRVCNVPIIDFTIDWILRTEVKRVVILVSEKNMSYLRPVEEQWRTFFEQFHIVSCKNAMSVGDALRELDGRAIVTSDFLLITNPATFTNSTLKKQIEQFRARRKANKNNVMTLIYTKLNQDERSVVGIKKSEGTLAYFHRADNPSKLDVDLPLFLNDVSVRRDIIDSGIALCSVNILVQFSTNFDFKQRDDVIREILVNEEILLQNIHVDVLNETECAVQIYDYQTYLFVSSLLLDRWLYPLCLDNMFQYGDYAFTSNGRNIYYALEREDIGSLKGTHGSAILGLCAVIGTGCQLGAAIKVVASVIGEGTTIGGDTTKTGLGTRITNSIIGRNCQIGSGCILEQVVLGDFVIIPDGYQLEKRSIIGSNVILPQKLEDRSISDCALCSIPPNEDDEEVLQAEKLEGGLYVWKLTSGYSFWSKLSKYSNDLANGASRTGASDEDILMDEDSASDAGGIEPTSVFQEEILDSMTRILEMNFTEQLINNLILEINSSKLANNISMEDVAKYLFKTFLCLEQCKTLDGLKKLSLRWKSLFSNYYRPRKSQIQLLMAIEEHFEHLIDELRRPMPHIVHFLYDEDNGLGLLEEEAIFEWYETLDPKSPIRVLMVKIIEWLRADSSEDESDDD